MDPEDTIMDPQDLWMPQMNVVTEVGDVPDELLEIKVISTVDCDCQAMLNDLDNTEIPKLTQETGHMTWLNEVLEKVLANLKEKLSHIHDAHNEINKPCNFADEKIHIGDIMDFVGYFPPNSGQFVDLIKFTCKQMTVQEFVSLLMQKNEEGLHRIRLPLQKYILQNILSIEAYEYHAVREIIYQKAESLNGLLEKLSSFMHMKDDLDPKLSMKIFLKNSMKYCVDKFLKLEDDDYGYQFKEYMNFLLRGAIDFAEESDLNIRGTFIPDDQPNCILNQTVQGYSSVIFVIIFILQRWPGLHPDLATLFITALHTYVYYLAQYDRDDGYEGMPESFFVKRTGPSPSASQLSTIQDTLLDWRRMDGFLQPPTAHQYRVPPDDSNQEPIEDPE